MNKEKEKKQIQIGGQAVIEGVMMRGPQFLATAIRREDKSIEIKKQKFLSKTKQNKFFGFPVVRGFVSLIEMLIIGIKTLSFSASRAELDWEKKEKNKKKEKSKSREKTEEILSYLFAFGLAFVLFAFLPYQFAPIRYQHPIATAIRKHRLVGHKNRVLYTIDGNGCRYLALRCYPIGVCLRQVYGNFEVLYRAVAFDR